MLAACGGARHERREGNCSLACCSAVLLFCCFAFVSPTHQPPCRLSRRLKPLGPSVTRRHDDGIFKTASDKGLSPTTGPEQCGVSPRALLSRPWLNRSLP